MIFARKDFGFERMSEKRNWVEAPNAPSRGVIEELAFRFIGGYSTR
jgi:hypothetical protein